MSQEQNNEKVPSGGQEGSVDDDSKTVQSQNEVSRQPDTTVAPKMAIWLQAQKILNAEDHQSKSIFLSELGGIIGDIIGRDGDSVEKAEANAALSQIGVPSDAYPALENAILGAADNHHHHHSASTSSKGKGKKDKKGQSKGVKPIVYSKKQFVQLMVSALQQSLERFENEAREERKPPVIIKEKDIKSLREIKSQWNQTSALADFLGETDHRADVRSGILVDFFSHHLFKCFEEDIDDLRTAIFLTVMKQVLDAANEKGWVSAQDSFRDFTSNFVKFCTVDKQYEYEPFTVEQARSLTHHVSATFFRFFSSFKFAFTRPRDTEEVEEQIFAEEPMAPRPLSEAAQHE